MAAVFRNWARNRFTEGISGHISVRDPEFPDCIWMNPIGRHFSLLNGSDMLCLRIADGAIVGGNRVSDSDDLAVPFPTPAKVGQHQLEYGEAIPTLPPKDEPFLRTAYAGLCIGCVPCDLHPAPTFSLT